MFFRDLDGQEEESDEDVLEQGEYCREEEEEVSAEEGEDEVDGTTIGCAGVDVDETMSYMGADTRGDEEAAKGTGSAGDMSIAGHVGEGDVMDLEGKDEPVAQADSVHESGEQGFKEMDRTHLDSTRTDPSTTAHAHTDLSSRPLTTTGCPSGN